MQVHELLVVFQFHCTLHSLPEMTPWNTTNIAGTILASQAISKEEARPAIAHVLECEHTGIGLPTRNNNWGLSDEKTTVNDFVPKTRLISIISCLPSVARFWVN